MIIIDKVMSDLIGVCNDAKAGDQNRFPRSYSERAC